MAPLKPTKSDKRLQAVIDCAERTLHHLKQRTALPPNLLSEIGVHIKQSLPSLSAAVVVTKAQDIDALGTDIWNASADILHEDVGPRDPRVRASHGAQLGVLVRIFALLLLDASHHASSRRSRDMGQRMRLFKISIKAARLCLEQGQLETAVVALEKCSGYVATSQESTDLIDIAEKSPENGDEPQVLRALEREYFLLRIMHAWKSQRMDLADHFYQSFAKKKVMDCTEGMTVSDKAANLFYDLARYLSKCKDPPASTKWYERAFCALDNFDAHAYTQESTELLLSIGVSLVEALLASPDDASHRRATEIVQRLENTQGLENRIALSIIKLQVLASHQHADPESLLRTLLRLIRLAVLTRENFKVIMQTIQKADRLAGAPALVALKTFICDRILPEMTASQAVEPQTQDWLEKATVTYVYFATRQSSSSTGQLCTDLKQLLDAIQHSGGIQISTKATHAAQTLLWKAAGQSTSNGDHDIGALLQHPIFDNAGHINKSRIGRKLMRDALEAKDLPAARKALYAMPPTSQSEPMTAYLSFKLALLGKEQELAESSLLSVMKHANKDPTFLYACVLDAQQSDMKQLAVLSLRAILEQRPPGVHLSSLLRCIARLLIAELDAPEQDVLSVAKEVVSIFEIAASSIEHLRKSPDDQWRAEMQWWSKNAYNLAVRLCASIHPEDLIQLLDVCLKFLACFPTDSALMRQAELKKRKMLCSHLSTTALIVLGRCSEEEEETQYTRQCFLHAHQKIKMFKSLLNQLNATDQDDETSQRALAMLKFELECVLKLQQWDALAPALQSCLNARGVDRWDTLADLLIIIHSHLDTAEQSSSDSETTHLLTQLLQKIINDTWKKDKSIAKVSRWLRFTFKLCLPHTEGDFSLKLLEQAAKMAENGQRGKIDMYPEAELQWLATMGFNHAVDLVSGGKGEEAMKWMEAALEVARWADDGGQLHAILTEKQGAVRERVEMAEQVGVR